MDKATLGGLLLGLGGILLGLMLEGGNLGQIIQPTAAMIVFGGTMGAVLINFPLPVVISALRQLANVVMEPHRDARSTIEVLVRYANQARREGIVSLDRELPNIQEPFLRRSLMLAVDGTEPQELRKIMELELDNLAEREDKISQVFESAGGFSPTIGIIGAVLGLIQVMQHLDKIDEVGRGIAVAFVATIYGVGAANLLLSARCRKAQDPDSRRAGHPRDDAGRGDFDPGGHESAHAGNEAAGISVGNEGTERGARGRGPCAVSRRKKRGSHPNHERWLVSYADFITLLFAFFVVMYSTAQVDQRKVGKLALAIQVAFQELGVFNLEHAGAARYAGADAIQHRAGDREREAQYKHRAHRSAPGEALGGGGGGENGDLTQLQHELESLLSSQIARKEIAVRREPDGLVISLREVGFFESGSAQMKATSRESFDQIAGLLHARDYRLRIEGHTDNVPIHTGQFASNWELSTARATELVRLLIVRDGFSPSRLSAAGYAEYHPVADNGSNEGRGMNRRVDIVILGHGLPALPVASEGNPTDKPSAAIEAKPRS